MAIKYHMTTVRIVEQGALAKLQCREGSLTEHVQQAFIHWENECRRELEPGANARRQAVVDNLQFLGFTVS